MTIEEMRKKAADFLDEIRTGVEQMEPHAFDFSSYVSEFDEKHRCGTICCMAGWVPKIRPDLAIWEYDEETGWMPANHPGIRMSDNVFEPCYAGIPIQPELWAILTRPRSQNCIGELDLEPGATLTATCALWERIAIQIRSGKLDKYILPF